MFCHSLPGHGARGCFITTPRPPFEKQKRSALLRMAPTANTNENHRQPGKVQNDTLQQIPAEITCTPGVHSNVEAVTKSMEYNATSTFSEAEVSKNCIKHALPTSSPCTRQCKNDLMDWTHRTRSLIDPVILSPAAKCIKRELRRFSGNHPTRSRSSWYGEKQNGRIS